MNKIDKCGQLESRLYEETLSIRDLLLSCYAVLLSTMTNKSTVQIYVQDSNVMKKYHFLVDDENKLVDLVKQSKKTGEDGFKEEETYDGVFLYRKQSDSECQNIAKIPDDCWNLQCIENQCQVALDFSCVGYCDTYYSLMANRMSRIVEQFVSNGKILVKDIERKGRREEVWLKKFTKVNTESIDNLTFHELFEQQAEKYPQRIAVQCGEDSITFGELNERANQIAHYICEYLSGSQSMIGIFMERSISFVASLLGIMKSGNAYVPIDPDTLNPGHNGSFPLKRLAFMVEDTQMEMVISNSKYSGYLPKERITILDTDLTELGGYPKGNLNFPVSRGNIIYGIYTSGSTGYPKVTIVEHSSVINLYQNLKKYAFTYLDGIEQPVVSQNAPFGFDASVQQLVGLLNGYCVAILPEAVRNSVHKLVQYLEEKKVNLFDCTPPQLDLLLSSGILEKCRENLKVILLGGEAIPYKMWKQLRKEKDIQVMNVYGPTECTVDSTIYNINDSEYDYPVIGRPIDNAQIFILDKMLRQVPIGCTGEICIAGALVSRGYFNRDELNEEQFLETDAVRYEGKKLYRTGDKGTFLCDGTIQYFGRMDSQVKIRSHRIELNEIIAILNKHENIKDSLVVMDRSTGYEKLIAYVRSNEAMDFAVEELSDYLAQYLPSYMLPNHYILIYKWPLTANKKIDKKRLPLPRELRLIEKKESRELTDELTMGITKIVSQILKVDYIGQDESFMTLGGDSLRVMTLLAEILSEYGVEIDFQDFFDSPTISFIREKIKAEKGE